MIRYDPASGVVTMDLTDLEHCGFDHDEYAAELFTSGIEDEHQAGAQWPVALMVNFAGGYVLWGGNEPEDKDARKAERDEAAKRFGVLAGLVMARWTRITDDQETWPPASPTRIRLSESYGGEWWERSFTAALVRQLLHSDPSHYSIRPTYWRFQDTPEEP